MLRDEVSIPTPPRHTPRFCLWVFDRCSVQHRFGVVAMGEQVRVVQKMTSDLRPIMDAIDRLEVLLITPIYLRLPVVNVLC